MIDIRPILHVIGILLSILALFMLLPAFLDWYNDQPNWGAFLEAAFVTAFVGICLFLSNARSQSENLTVKQAFILTTLVWLNMALFSALPLYFSDTNMGFTDSFFESMSGMTTTGSTVMVGLDGQSKGILLWRALIQWLGGVGFIVMAMAILPLLKIGGMQLFRTESSDRSEKALPRARQVASAIGGTYLLLTVLAVITFWAAGMTAFDALCHAMSTLSTAGFSTHDASVGYYNDALIEASITLFMAIGGVPIILFAQFLRGKPGSLLRDSQVRWYIGTLALSIFLVSAWLVNEFNIEWSRALRMASFNVVSVITTTGFATQDYYAWGSFVVLSMFLLGVVGGCTGSTAGGIKIFRFQVLYETTRAQINQLVQPHGVFKPIYNGKPISEQVTSSVITFIILFGTSFSILAVLLSLTGLDYITSMSGAATAMANLGPGLGPIIGPAGNFSSLPDAAKWLLSFGMLLGRLEIFTVLILFSRYFWRN